MNHLIKSFFCFLFFKGGICFAQSANQNLVINPSFEMYSTCPGTFTTEFKNEIVPGWTSPNDGTPDYFNSCSSGDAGVPENWAGYCEAVVGQAYLGMYLFRAPNYREFIQASLDSALTQSENYILSFYLSRSIYEALHIDELGVLLVQESFHAGIGNRIDTFDPSENTAHKKGKLKLFDEYQTSIDVMNIDTSQGQYIPFDLSKLELKEDWYYVRLKFKAELAAAKIIVGNFTPIEHINVKESACAKLAVGTMLEKSSYIFLDDFALYSTDHVEHFQAEIIPDPIIISDVNFEINSANLAREGLDRMDSVSMLLNGSWNLLISGHTDDLGTSDYNLELSRQRAQNVANYLIAHGVAAHRIQVEAKGEELPMVPNSSDYLRSLNRRVEIYFLRTED